MIVYFWRCSACWYQTPSRTERTQRPLDHWALRLDGNSRICRGPFQEFEAKSL